MPDFMTDSWEDIEKFFGLNGQTTANTGGMTAKQASVATDSATIKNAGILTSVFGAATSAIGQFYAAKTQQYQLKSQASSLAFQSGMDAINAHQAELSAQSIEVASQKQIESYTMQAGQKAASTVTAQASRGIDLSSQSAVEERASEDLVKQIDVMTINANATRQAWAARTQETDDSNASLLTRTSAVNTLASSKTVSPFLAASTSLLNSASMFASQWDYRNRLRGAV